MEELIEEQMPYDSIYIKFCKTKIYSDRKISCHWGMVGQARAGERAYKGHFEVMDMFTIVAVSWLHGFIHRLIYQIAYLKCV